MHFRDSKDSITKRVRDSGEYLVPQIRCNIYRCNGKNKKLNDVSLVATIICVQVQWKK